MLLDEPTNHLDIESIQWLENFLSTRANAVVLVSHDRAFLNLSLIHIYELLDALRSDTFDVLLTDVQMPAINGFDLLKLLRASNPVSYTHLPKR